MPADEEGPPRWCSTSSNSARQGPLGSSAVPAGAHHRAEGCGVVLRRQIRHPQLVRALPQDLLQGAQREARAAEEPAAGSEPQHATRWTDEAHGSRFGTAEVMSSLHGDCAAV